MYILENEGDAGIFFQKTLRIWNPLTKTQLFDGQIFFCNSQSSRILEKSEKLLIRKSQSIIDLLRQTHRISTPRIKAQLFDGANFEKTILETEKIRFQN